MKKYLLIFQLFVALGALVPGFLLVYDPSGKSVGLSIELVEHTIFVNYLIPGLFLFIVHGVGRVFAIYTGLTNKIFYAHVGMALGATLIIWIVIQIALIGLVFWLQPFFLLIGFIECGFSYVLIARRY